MKLLLKCRILVSSRYTFLEQFNVIYRCNTEDTKSWYMDLIIWEDCLILSMSWMETSHSFPWKKMGKVHPSPPWHTTLAPESRIPSSHFFILIVHASGMFYPRIHPLCNTSATGLLCQLPNLVFPFAVLPFLLYKLLFLSYPSAGSSKLFQNTRTLLSAIISQNTLIFYSSTGKISNHARYDPLHA